MAFIFVNPFLLLLLQHVPKTNGEIPSVDEAISDHQRLLDRYKTVKCQWFVTHQ
jgi:hypothetical protein